MKLVIFDFDGVLVDTLGIAFAINVKAEPTLSLEKYKSFFEGNIHDAIKSGKKKFIPDFDEHYSEMTRELAIPPALKKIVQKLYANNVLSIASSSSTYLIEDILKREGIDNCFKDVWGSDMHQSKIIKIKKLLEKYKVVPEEAVFITDTAGDILEGRECKVKSIAVTWGFHDEKTLQKAMPAKIVSTPEDLIKAIEEI